MLANDAPPLVERCHCTVGVGTPDAEAVNVTDVPGCTVWSDGLVVTAGAWFTWTCRVWLAVGARRWPRGRPVGAARPRPGCR